MSPPTNDPRIIAGMAGRMMEAMYQPGGVYTKCGVLLEELVSSYPEARLGHDVASHDEAHKIAIEFTGEILLHEARALVEGHDLTVTVWDENHLVLFSVYAISVPSPITGNVGKTMRGEASSNIRHEA